MNLETVIKIKEKTMLDGNPYKVHSYEYVMWIARLFLLNAMIHLKSDAEDIFDNVVEKDKNLPKNVIDIYKRASELLIIELQ